MTATTTPSPPNFRKLARQVLQVQYPGQLHQADLKELVECVASQWQRFDGHAGLIFGNHILWLDIDTQRCQIGVAPISLGGNGLQFFVNDYDIPPGQLPALACTLNLRQRVEFRNRAGDRLCFHLDPVKRALSIERLPEEA